jgi:hypothetical protein
MSARLRALGRWLFIDTAAFWLAVAPPCLLILLSTQLRGATELHMRVVGYTLTLLGVVLVLYGLRDTRKLFAKPSYDRRIVGWLRRFPAIWRPTMVTAAAATGGVRIGGSAAGFVRSGAASNSVSARLRAAEENLRRVDERITEVEASLRQEIQNLRSELTAELGRRDEDSAALAAKMEQFAAGSLDATLVGVAWAVVGQLLGAFPLEIATRLFPPAA